MLNETSLTRSFGAKLRTILEHKTKCAGNLNSIQSANRQNFPINFSCNKLGDKPTKTPNCTADNFSGLSTLPSRSANERKYRNFRSDLHPTTFRPEVLSIVWKLRIQTIDDNIPWSSVYRFVSAFRTLPFDDKFPAVFLLAFASTPREQKKKRRRNKNNANFQQNFNSA